MPKIKYYCRNVARHRLLELLRAKQSDPKKVGAILKRVTKFRNLYFPQAEIFDKKIQRKPKVLPKRYPIKEPKKVAKKVTDLLKIADLQKKRILEILKKQYGIRVKIAKSIGKDKIPTAYVILEYPKNMDKTTLAVITSKVSTMIDQYLETVRQAYERLVWLQLSEVLVTLQENVRAKLGEEFDYISKRISELSKDPKYSKEVRQSIESILRAWKLEDIDLDVYGMRVLKSALLNTVGAN
ncbi:MAG: hypothetical protein QXM75_03925 [Candidatus Diapherotrites archaeon]